MTIVNLMHAIHQAFIDLGATHVHTIRHASSGVEFTKNFIVVACRIPAHLHGVFHCSGWVSRP